VCVWVVLRGVREGGNKETAATSQETD
jgi:hypothetical protein